MLGKDIRRLLVSEINAGSVDLDELKGKRIELVVDTDFYIYSKPVKELKKLDEDFLERNKQLIFGTKENLIYTIFKLKNNWVAVAHIESSIKNLINDLGKKEIKVKKVSSLPATFLKSLDYKKNNVGYVLKAVPIVYVELNEDNVKITTIPIISSTEFILRLPQIVVLARNSGISSITIYSDTEVEGYECLNIWNLNFIGILEDEFSVSRDILLIMFFLISLVGAYLLMNKALVVRKIMYDELIRMKGAFPIFKKVEDDLKKEAELYKELVSMTKFSNVSAIMMVMKKVFKNLPLNSWVKKVEFSGGKFTFVVMTKGFKAYRGLSDWLSEEGYKILSANYDGDNGEIMFEIDVKR